MDVIFRPLGAASGFTRVGVGVGASGALAVADAGAIAALGLLAGFGAVVVVAAGVAVAVLKADQGWLTAMTATMAAAMPAPAIAMNLPRDGGGSMACRGTKPNSSGCSAEQQIGPESGPPRSARLG